MNESPGDTLTLPRNCAVSCGRKPVVAAEDLHGRHRDDRPARRADRRRAARSAPEASTGSAPSNSRGLPALRAGVRPVDLRLEVAAVDRDGRRRQAVLDRGDAEMLDRVGHRRRQHRARCGRSPSASWLIWRLMMRTSTESAV